MIIFVKNQKSGGKPGFLREARFGGRVQLLMVKSSGRMEEP
ncbi:hypothetical protein SPLC1_S370680 [Arthrospira platensis C1]|nr:hypothetical protein SPLC1_S370680 [Arthrospira platensis C1]